MSSSSQKRLANCLLYCQCLFCCFFYFPCTDIGKNNHFLGIVTVLHIPTIQLLCCSFPPRNIAWWFLRVQLTRFCTELLLWALSLLHMFFCTCCFFSHQRFFVVQTRGSPRLSYHCYCFLRLQIILLQIAGLFCCYLFTCVFSILMNYYISSCKKCFFGFTGVRHILLFVDEKLVSILQMYSGWGNATQTLFILSHIFKNAACCARVMCKGSSCDFFRVFITDEGFPSVVQIF